MRKKGWLAAALALSMTFTMMPFSALAAEDTANDPIVTQDSTGNVVLSKKATLADDGTYTIDLEAYAKGTVEIKEEPVPLDIVLVLDQSGSMGEGFQTVTEDVYTKYSGAYNTAFGTALYHKASDGSYHPVDCTREWVWTGYKYTFKCDTPNCTSDLAKGISHQCTGVGLTTIRDKVQNDFKNNNALYTKNTVSSEQSRLTALKNSVTAFVNAVKANDTENANVEHRIAMVGFASQSGYGNNTEILTVAGPNNNYGNNQNDSIGVAYNNLTSTEYSNALVSATNDKNNYIQHSIDVLAANGATRTDLGMEMAKKILDADTKTDSKKIVIMFTDGVPTSSNTFDATVANSAVTTAKALKAAGVDVYTVGIFQGADGSKLPNSTSSDADKANYFMHAVSSNYPNATSYTNVGTLNKYAYYMSANDADSLNAVFKSISQTITGNTSVTLDANSVLKDVMATGFDASNATVTVKTAEYKGNNTWGTAAASSLTGTIENGTVTVTGFNYKDEFVAEKTSKTAAKGKKLIVTITGVELTDAAEIDTLIDTNVNTSGVYANASAETPVVAFGQPKTEVSSKAFVLDYAKSASINATDATMTATKITTDTKKGFNFDSSKLSYGSVTVSGATASYTPNTMQWNGYDTMYSFGAWKTVPTGVTTGSNVWAKVSVIPADAVYYEDDFGTKKGETGITYTGTWTVDGTAGGNTETANSNLTGGWTDKDVNDLANDLGYSDGSAHSTTASGTPATASFEFTGNGFEIYSKTTGSSGTIFVVAAGTKTYAYSINTISESGDYYQIPVLQALGLDYDTYTVTIYVTTASAGKLDFNLDGIRIFNPIEDKDETVEAAYDANDLGGTYTLVKDIAEGTVFIDKDEHGKLEAETDDPKSIYGPYNEVYLAAGKSIVLKPETAEEYYVGIKAVEGAAGKATVSVGDAKAEAEINSSADLYYNVAPMKDGTIVISNTGDTMIALTNIRTKGTAIQTMSITDEEAIDAMNAFLTLPYANMKEADSVEEAVGNVTIVNSKVTEMFNKIMISAEKIFAGLSGWFN